MSLNAEFLQFNAVQVLFETESAMTRGFAAGLSAQGVCKMQFAVEEIDSGV